jgi:hypothetical protein
MPGREQLPVEIRAAGASEPLPDGWVVEPWRWNGQDVEVAYDARQVRVGRICAGPAVDLRRQLAANGWRHVSTDSEDAELWIVTTEDLALSRLDGLAARASGAEQQPLGIA